MKKELKTLWAFEGYVVEKVSLQAQELQVQIRRDKRFGLPCPNCGAQMAVNREHSSKAKDLPCISVRCVIEFPTIQGRCSSCKTSSTVRPKEIDSTCGATLRLMNSISGLARHLPLTDVGDYAGISGATAYRWDRKVLERSLPKPCLIGLRVLLIDEKSVRKGHGYVTLVMNGDTGELLYMGEGKKKASLRKFLKTLSEEQKKSIEAVCIDRNGAYQAVIKEDLPDAAIVFDKFHLMKNLNEALNEVRKSEFQAAIEEERAVIKGQRYNLMRHEENLPLWAKPRFEKMLQMNENLHVGYLLKEAFGLVWEYKQPKRARDYLEQWVEWTHESAIAPLVRFAKGVSRDAQRIVAFTRHQITNGRLEGFNNQVARIIHKACGIRNTDYLFLKLRQQSLPQI